MKTITKKSKENRREWKKTAKRLPLLLLFFVVFILVKLAQAAPDRVEKVFSAKVYPRIYSFVSSVTSMVQVSIAEIVIFAVTVAFIVLLLMLGYKLICHKVKFASFVRVLIGLAAGIGVFVNLFYCMWGFNYCRPELSVLMPMTEKTHTDYEFEELCKLLIDEAKKFSKSSDKEKTHDEYFELVSLGYQKLGEKYKIFDINVKKAKAVKMSELLSHCNIAGIYIPFTAEANVNVHQPLLLIPYDAAHESAHALGFAREEEANFIAYICCMESDNDFVKYSGTMGALLYCMDRMYEISPKVYDELLNLYSEKMKNDLEEYQKYWSKYNGVAAKIADDVNDAYLVANGQENGTDSYGMMTELLLDYYF
ncbi:MAG: DUF3810 domain-containing protein [Clostridia bacterium]|nr:DUF3810 domain-containing protein [Clostridia bacterium]